eukprot:g6113.t1
MALVYRHVPSGDPDDPDEPIYRRPRFSGAREEWWWQPGPVDACCCCGWSLRAGVGLLALSHLMLAALYSYCDTGRSFYHAMTVVIGKQYRKECEGVVPESFECRAVRENWVTFSNRLSFLQTYDVLFHVSETLSIVAGILGLWAVFRANALAAKMYLWSWLLLSSLGQTMYVLKVCSDYSNIENANAAAPPTASQLGHHWGAIIFFRLVTLIWVVYCFKVIRSYHIRLKDKNRDDAASTTGGIELDTYEDHETTDLIGWTR